MTSYKLDEPLSPTLRDLFPPDADVDTVADEALLGADDDSVAAAASVAGRVVVTADRRFAMPAPLGHPGVVVLWPHVQGAQQFAALLQRFLAEVDVDLTGRVVTVRPTGIRYSVPARPQP